MANIELGTYLSGASERYHECIEACVACLIACTCTSSRSSARAWALGAREDAA